MTKRLESLIEYWQKSPGVLVREVKEVDISTYDMLDYSDAKTVLRELTRAVEIFEKDYYDIKVDLRLNWSYDDASEQLVFVGKRIENDREFEERLYCLKEHELEKKGKL
jgi:hypothetical protein